MLLSPHEIAALMVLACTPCRLDGELPEVRALLGRGLVQLDADASGHARVRLSVQGRDVVSRLVSTPPASE
ncbi:hypothetical protein [Burkholderia ubonensis]|uniref:Preprotein translocase subunit SecA n=1 Tax=Burkholderia ubonensis subsp. mesacidophila TaxID=265293 RepID=A0A2A4FBH4_9BURK|nr:hypothetical protein [Burkholderia ubonensis]PCE30495.1 hypothetical protein BZL54_20670 [Burkholderia ubonensis subsp. mesacidophila]